MPTVIKVENLSKYYRLGLIGGKTLHDDLNRWWARVRKQPDPLLKIGQENRQNGNGESIWALRDINFEVQQGEIVGIIGRNGAGKSTLLKILSRITAPTSGQIKVKGRIASLLEVGTGFHPELAGRENIYLNGAILGMKKAEIDRKFDEIVAFAEVEKFIDTPVKRYSSGMYVRLAFAVAAHLEPEILVVDEVLAVGDAAFQKKCLGKMGDVAKEGRTVLFVSHNMAAISQLTVRCFLLNEGSIIFSGNSQTAVENYLQMGSVDSQTIFHVKDTPRKYLGTLAVKFLLFRFNRPVPHFAPDEDFSFVASIQARQNISRLRVSMTIFSYDGVSIGSCFSSERFSLKAGQYANLNVTLPFPRLAPGRYYCGVAIGKGNHKTGHIDYDVVLDTLHFEVVPPKGDAGTLSFWSQGWGRIMFSDLEVGIAINDNSSTLSALTS